MNVGILWRKLIQLLQHPITIFLVFMLPIGATLGVGQVVEKGQKELAVPIAIIDEDQTEFSRLIAVRLQNQSNIELQEVTNSRAEKLLLRNEVDSVFKIKEGFQKKLLQEKRENAIEVWVTPSSLAVGIVQELVASEVIRLTSNTMAANQVEKLYQQKGESNPNIWDKAFTYTDTQWNPEPLMTIAYVQSGGNHDAPKSESNFFEPYIGLWAFFTMLACFITMDWIVKERDVLFSRLKTTYRGVTAYVIQTSGSYFLLHMLQAVLASIILEANLSSMLLFVFISITLSTLTASYVKKVNSYYIASSLVVLSIGILGGSFFPIQELSREVATISVLFPQTILTEGQSDIHVVLTVFVAIAVWALCLRRLNRQT
ncbi:ABC transporter permease [Fredinandcohnia humi]